MIPEEEYPQGYRVEKIHIHGGAGIVDRHVPVDDHSTDQPETCPMEKITDAIAVALQNPPDRNYRERCPTIPIGKAHIQTSPWNGLQGGQPRHAATWSGKTHCINPKEITLVVVNKKNDKMNKGGRVLMLPSHQAIY